MIEGVAKLKSEVQAREAINVGPLASTSSNAVAEL